MEKKNLKKFKEYFMDPRHLHHHVTHSKISTHATHAKISTHATHALTLPTPPTLFSRLTEK